MKKKMPYLRSTITSMAVVSTMLTAFATANAEPDEQIRQRQQSHLLGHAISVGGDTQVTIGPVSPVRTRARVITSASSAAPDFVIEGQPYTTTPIDLLSGSASPNNYGVSGDVEARILVRINNTAISVDPFVTPRASAPYQVRQAQRRWMHDMGLVESARIVRHVDLSQRVTDDWSMRNDGGLPGAMALQAQKKANELPTPRATIEIHPGMLKKKPRVETPALEAALPLGADSVRPVLGMGNVEQMKASLAASINGTITVHVGSDREFKTEEKLATREQ